MSKETELDPEIPIGYSLDEPQNASGKDTDFRRQLSVAEAIMKEDESILESLGK